MKYVTLINGVKMPQLGYGVYQVSNAECEKAVLDAISVGYRSIDNVQAYGNEAAVGSAMAKSGIARDELFITTKVWISNLDDKESAFFSHYDPVTVEFLTIGDTSSGVSIL